MSDSNSGSNSDMIRFGESPGPEIQGFGESPPPSGEMFGPPLPEGFVPPELQGGAPEESGGKKGKKGKKAKREKKPRKAKKEKAEGKKKGSPKLLILIVIIAVAFVAAVIVTLLILKPWADKTPPADDPPEETESEPVETEPEPTPTPTPAPTPTPEPVEESLQEAVAFLKQLDPAVLGLEGESMDGYEVFPGGRVVMVDGIPCTEVNVYSTDNPTGSNDIQGRYFLTKKGARRLYSVDPFTNELTEVPLSGGS